MRPWLPVEEWARRKGRPPQTPPRAFWRPLALPSAIYPAEAKAGQEGVGLSFRADRRQERPDIHSQGPGQPADVVDGDISLPPLHRTHIRPVKPGFIGKSLLREPPLGPETPQVRRNEPTTVRRTRTRVRPASCCNSFPAHHAGNMDF